MHKFAVIGSGAWGTALAMVLSGNGNDVTIWSREEDVKNDILTNHENSLFLPGIKFKQKINVTTDVLEAIKGTEVIVIAVPAQFVRNVCKQITSVVKPNTPFLICSKGIEQSTGSLMSEVVESELPMVKIAVLSGPTFAGETARSIPTAVTIACKDEIVGKDLVNAFGSNSFRPYYSSDIIGAQVGGAVKNVLAIAAGIVEGKGLGDNARAALITRGLAEIVRLAKFKGGDETTLMGLSGIGDLLLTANSHQSRNYTVGFELGKGNSLDSIMAGKRSVAEGVFTAKAVSDLAHKIGVEMPICEAIHKILNEGISVDVMIASLLSRPFRSEK